MSIRPKPALSTYTDAALFVQGILFAAAVVEYSTARANQMVTQKAPSTTTLAKVQEAFLYEEACKISIAGSVGEALTRGLRLYPAAIERVEKIKWELPANATLN